MSNRRAVFAECQREAAAFSARLLAEPLYAYQIPPAQYIIDLVRASRTEDVTLEMARQSGKNEISGRIEAQLLTGQARSGGVIVKAAPTWSPQIVRSKMRIEGLVGKIKRRLPFLSFQGREGYILQCGNASINFLSGRATANVVGDTASLLLEIDEAQDFDLGKYDKEFAPMRASTGAPAVFYGTTWTDNTLLERTKIAIAEGRTRGRSFVIPWEVVANDNARYGEFVEGEIARLGETHPIIKTQYRLEAIEEQGRLLRADHLRLMIGDHPRLERRSGQGQIVAGLDFAGADEDAEELSSLQTASSRDSVALTVGSVDWVSIAPGVMLPLVRLLARYEWVNVHPASLQHTLYDLLLHKWRVDLCHSDATGLGETNTRLLEKSLNKGERTRIVGHKFDAAWSTHTRLAFQYIACVQGGRLLDYAPDGFDPLAVAKQELAPAAEVDQHAWWQRGQARLEARAGKKVRAYVPENKGHDDLLISEMLMVDAAYALTPRVRSSGIRQANVKGW